MATTIISRLWPQTQLCSHLPVLLAEAWQASPRNNDFVDDRLIESIKAQEDSELDPAWLQAADPELLRRLGVKPPQRRGAGELPIVAQARSVVASIPEAAAGFRRLVYDLNETPEHKNTVLKQLGQELRELAGGRHESRARQFAVDLLLELGADAAEVRSLLDGLPDSGPVRDLLCSRSTDEIAPEARAWTVNDAACEGLVPGRKRPLPR